MRKCLHFFSFQASPDTSIEDFDPVEVFVAIADFQEVEESNVSLRVGQCVQVRQHTRKQHNVCSQPHR